MGPNPVIVHDIPVAIRRFSLKYVLRASELEDVVMPMPEPATGVERREINQGMSRVLVLLVLPGRTNYTMRRLLTECIGYNCDRVLTIENGKGEEVGQERVGNGSEQQGKYDEQSSAKAHLAVGKPSEEGSICQSDSVSKCRVHVDDGRNFTRGDAQGSQSVSKDQSELLQHRECGELQGRRGRQTDRQSDHMLMQCKRVTGLFN